MRKFLVLFLAFFVFLMFSACSFLFANGSSKNKEITVVNWNVETFFDAITEGSEYSEFQKSSFWNESAYKKRLSLLAENLVSINADIFVLEEIENADVVYDILNVITNAWNPKKNWNYACFSKNKGDAIGCAVISRFPLKDLRLHNLDIRSDFSQPSMRPLLTVCANVFETEVIIAVNHWKSKSGGEEKSEIWRDLQESLLSRIFLENKTKPIIACGDFNRNLSEFQKIVVSYPDFMQSANILLGNKNSVFEYLKSESFSVHNPWFNEVGNTINPGSYYFKENWERIDHFFVNRFLYVTSFFPLTEGSWCNEEGIPNRYVLYSQSGFSDHLPVQCTVKIKEFE